MISVGLMSAPSEISLNDAKRISKTLLRNHGSENGMKRILDGTHIILYRRLAVHQGYIPTKSETSECHILSYSRMLLHDYAKGGQSPYWYFRECSL